MPAYPGRPREFKYEKRRELIDHIGQGATVEEAAQIVGVTLRTVQRAAKHDEFFDHDLQLALHAAPADPEKLVQRAARTHWRAAAWLLERTDPDRYAKRPPNSCSPETLMSMSDWLIETALEATPPAARESVYRRMRAVADKAFNVLMPDQHDARRCLVGALPHRPMPLSQHEWIKALQVVGDPHAPAGSLPAAPPAGELAPEPPRASSHPNGHNRDATHRRGVDEPAAIPMTRTSPTTPDATSIADPVSYYRRHPPRQSQPYERPSDSIGGFRLKDAAWRNGPLEEDEEEEEDDDATPAVGGVPDAAADAPAGRHWRPTSAEVGTRSAILTGETPGAHTSASSDPPNGGIMSPKMSAATECDKTRTDRPWATQCAAAAGSLNRNAM